MSGALTSGPGTDPEDLTELTEAHRTRERLTKGIFWACMAAIFVFSALQLGIVPERLLSAAPRVGFIMNIMLPPVIDGPMGVAQAAVESLQIAILGTVFGIILSLVLGFFAARNVTPIGPLSWGIKAFAGFVRAVPALVWALLFIIAVGFGPIPGILALAVNSIGMLAKVYAEAIEEIPAGPIEALRSCGASRTQIAIQGVLPSVVRTFIAWSVFRFDINIRYSAILGVVGAGGIGWELVRASQMGAYDRALGVTLVIFVMVMAAEFWSQWMRGRVDHAANV